MKGSMKVITTRDKQERDRLFRELRSEGAVKFSGFELSGAGDRVVRYSPKGKTQRRPIYVSTWSVAYRETK